MSPEVGGPRRVPFAPSTLVFITPISSLSLRQSDGIDAISDKGSHGQLLLRYHSGYRCKSSGKDKAVASISAHAQRPGVFWDNYERGCRKVLRLVDLCLNWTANMTNIVIRFSQCVWGRHSDRIEVTQVPTCMYKPNLLGTKDNMFLGCSRVRTASTYLHIEGDLAYDSNIYQHLSCWVVFLLRLTTEVENGQMTVAQRRLVVAKSHDCQRRSVLFSPLWAGGRLSASHSTCAT